MTKTLPATTGKSLVANLIGLMTLLCGGAYAAVGASLLVAWAELLPLDTDLADRIAIVRGMAYLALFGVLFLVLGIMALAAALGLYSRKPWGRTLTLIVAVLAISSGLCFDTVVPPVSGRGATDISLAVAQVLYGILAFAILSMNRGEPVGIYILRLLSILVGLPVVFSWGSWLLDSDWGGGGRRDTADFFATLSVLSGFVAGLLIVASGTCLLASRWKRRFVTVVALMIAAAIAQVALAMFALLGALLGHTREGLLEGILFLFVLPVAIVWLFLTVSGLWYLKRPHIRRVLEVE